MNQNSSESEVTYSGSATNSSTFYGAGTYVNGSFSLSSMVLQDSGSSADTLTTAGNDTYSGSGTSAETVLLSSNGNGGFGYGGYSGSGTGTYTSNACYSFNASESFSAADTSTGSFTDYQAVN